MSLPGLGERGRRGKRLCGLSERSLEDRRVLLLTRARFRGGLLA